MKLHPRPGWVAAVGFGAGALFAARRLDGFDLSTATTALHNGAVAVLVLAAWFAHRVRGDAVRVAVLYAAGWNALLCVFECLTHVGMRATIGLPPMGADEVWSALAALCLGIAAVRAARRATPHAADVWPTRGLVVATLIGHAAGWWAYREIRAEQAMQDLSPWLGLSLVASLVGPFTVMALPVRAALALRGQLHEPSTRSWAILLATASLLAWSGRLLSLTATNRGPSEISLAWHGSSIGEIAGFGIVVYLAARAALSSLDAEPDEA